MFLSSVVFKGSKAGSLNLNWFCKASKQTR